MSRLFPDVVVLMTVSFSIILFNSSDLLGLCLLKYQASQAPAFSSQIIQGFETYNHAVKVGQLSQVLYSRVCKAK